MSLDVNEANTGANATENDTSPCPQFVSFWPADDGVYPDDKGEPGDQIFFDGAPEMWGKYYWAKIHFSSFFYPEKPNRNTQQATFNEMDALRFTLPCGVCRDHYRANWKKRPLCNYLHTRAAFIEWTILLHDDVNEITGAGPFDYKRYLNNLTGTDAVVGESDDERDAVATAAAAPVETITKDQHAEPKKDVAAKKTTTQKQPKEMKDQKQTINNQSRSQTSRSSSSKKHDSSAMRQHAFHVQLTNRSQGTQFRENNPIHAMKTSLGAAATNAATTTAMKGTSEKFKKQQQPQFERGGYTNQNAAAITAARRAEALREEKFAKPKDCPNCSKRFLTPSSF